MKRGTIALAVGLTAALLAGAALADQAPRVPSTLTLSNGEPTIYEGAVGSKRSACKKRRAVKVFHDQNRNGVDGSDYLIGTDTTDKKGEYEVEGNQAPMGDQIIAQVKRRKLGDGTVCLTKEKSAIALAG